MNFYNSRKNPIPCPSLKSGGAQNNHYELIHLKIEKAISINFLYSLLEF
jgi:hypothetical protein